MVLKELKEFTAKHLPKISKIGKTMIKENNLIPCHAESFLLGFQFEPVGIDGSGYLAMYKKPYVSKRLGKFQIINQTSSKRLKEYTYQAMDFLRMNDKIVVEDIRTSQTVFNNSRTDTSTVTIDSIEAAVGAMA
ncbi:hypothetical protein FQA39_LY19138 [Lamprigera yunnana]|nr:hypothetical protein FQA39_LY19138 [Lamprigera yunnana]